mgnify:CR=1 FL=1
MQPINVHADLTITAPNNVPVTVKSAGKQVTVNIPDLRTALYFRGKRGVTSTLGVKFTELMLPHADINVTVNIKGRPVAELYPGQPPNRFAMWLGLDPFSINVGNALRALI